jgi:hypothetical protein
MRTSRLLASAHLLHKRARVACLFGFLSLSRGGRRHVDVRVLSQSRPVPERDARGGTFASKVGRYSSFGSKPSVALNESRGLGQAEPSLEAPVGLVSEGRPLSNQPSKTLTVNFQDAEILGGLGANTNPTA